MHQPPPVAILWDLSSKPANVQYGTLAPALKVFAQSLGVVISFRGYVGGEQAPLTRLAIRESLVAVGAGLTTYKGAEPVNVERLLFTDMLSVLLDTSMYPTTIVAAVSNPSAFGYAIGALAQRGKRLVLVACGAAAGGPVVDWGHLLAAASEIPTNRSGNPGVPSTPVKQTGSLSSRELFRMPNESPTPLPSSVSIHVQAPTPQRAPPPDTPPQVTNGLLRLPRIDDDVEGPPVQEETEEEYEWTPPVSNVTTHSSLHTPPNHVERLPFGSIGSHSSSSDLDIRSAHARRVSLTSIPESESEGSDSNSSSKDTPAIVQAAQLTLGERGNGRIEPQSSPTTRRASQRKMESIHTSDDEQEKILRASTSGQVDASREEWPVPSSPNSIKVPLPLQTSFARSLATGSTAFSTAAASGTTAAGKYTSTGAFRPAVPTPSLSTLSPHLRDFQPLVDAIIRIGGAHGTRVERGFVGSEIAKSQGKGFYATVDCDSFSMYSRNAVAAGVVEMGMSGATTGWVALCSKYRSPRKW